MASDHSRQGVACSLLIHAVFFGLLALLVLIKQLRSEPEPVILTLESPPSETMQEPSPNPEPNLPDIAPPPLAEIQPVDFPKIPDPPPPEPPPPAPQPTPPPPTPTPPAPTPTPAPTPPAPRPAPTPVPQPPRVSADDFFRDRPRPEQTQVRPRPTQPQPAPRIHVPDVTRALEEALRDTQASQSSESEQRALLAYIARLRRQIELAWNKPTTAAERDEWVEVIVTVEPNGRISGHRVLRQGASATFLRTVDDAVRATRSIGPTPHGRRMEVKYTLRLREE